MAQASSAYSDLKAAWHLGKISRLRGDQQIVPAQVQLIISDLCNQNCHFCAYRMDGGFSTEQFRDGENINPNRKIPTEKCLEILDDCAAIGVKAIQFTGGGEPTVHPDHLKIFKHALDLGLECSLVTNGTRLLEGWEEVLPFFKWIRVSVDAGTKQTYAKVRDVKERVFDKVCANIRDLVYATRRSDTLLGVGYVVTKENWQEIYRGCKTFRDLGVPYVRVSAMFSEQGSDYYGDMRGEMEVEAESCSSLENPSFKIVDLFRDRISDLDQGAPDYDFCGYQQFNCYIGGNQKVYRCCTTSYTKHGEVGDLTGQSFKKWFNSEEKQDAYANFKASSCHTCQFNSKNRVINYMKDDDPLHVNYV